MNYFGLLPFTFLRPKAARLCMSAFPFNTKHHLFFLSPRFPTSYYRLKYLILLVISRFNQWRWVWAFIEGTRSTSNLPECTKIPLFLAAFALLSAQHILQKKYCTPECINITAMHLGTGPERSLSPLSLVICLILSVSLQIEGARRQMTNVGVII